MNKWMTLMEAKRDALDVRVQGLKGLQGKKGFTLIELIVVMAIIGILVLLAAPRFLGYTKDAAASAVQQDAKVLSDAAFQYNIEHEDWPAGDEATVLIGTEEHEAVYLDETLKTEGFVKNLSNEFGDYVLITEGELEGDVVSIDGQADKNGDTVHGANLMDEKDNDDDDIVVY